MRGETERPFPGSLADFRRTSINNSQNLLFKTSGETRIVINVGGKRFQTTYQTLRKHPNTLLYNLFEDISEVQSIDNYDLKRKELYFDKDPIAFEVILGYYRSGHLHKPTNSCGPAFARELHEWGIDFMELDLCCWKSFIQYYPRKDITTNNEMLNFINNPDFKNSLRGKIWTILYCKRRNHFFRKIRVKMNYFVIPLLIFALIINTSDTLRSIKRDDARCMALTEKDESMSTKSKMECTLGRRTIHFIDYLSLIYFVPDIVFKLLTSPNYILFFSYTDNWINLMSTIVTGTMVFGENLTQSTILRCINLLRVFSVVRKTAKMRVFLKFLQNVSGEMLLMMRVFALLFISTGYIYYCLCSITHSNLKSMVKGFWWSSISLTTVGYGDVIPNHMVTIIFTGVCIVLSRLVLTMPMPLLVKKFHEAVDEID